MSIETTAQENSSTLIIKPDQKPKGIVAFVSIILIGFIGVLFQSLYQLIIGEYNLLFIAFLCLFYWMAYFNFFHFYWAALGDEIIEISENSFTITKKVWILKRSKKYKKHKIGQLQIVDSSNAFGASGVELFGFSHINVRFKYGRKKDGFGKQINLKEAESIADELKKWGYHIEPLERVKH